MNSDDMVPRSRYDACNADWLAAKDKLAEVQSAARIEIERLERENSDLHAQIKRLTENKDRAQAELFRLVQRLREIDPQFRAPMHLNKDGA